MSALTYPPMPRSFGRLRGLFVFGAQIQMCEGELVIALLMLAVAQPAWLADVFQDAEQVVDAAPPAIRARCERLIHDLLAAYPLREQPEVS